MNNLNFKIEDLKVGTIVTYVNGSPSVYTGKIIKVRPVNSFVIIDVNDEASFALINAHIRCGSDIQLDQIKSIVKA